MAELRKLVIGAAIAVAALVAAPDAANANSVYGSTNNCTDPITTGKALDQQTHTINYNKNFIYSGVQWKRGYWSSVSPYSFYTISSNNIVQDYGDLCP